MNAALVIRPVQAQDWDQWLPLWQGNNAFYGRSGATALPDEITRCTWARFFDAYEPVHGLVAVRGERLVGLAHYLFHRNTAKIGPSCYLNDLFTDEALRSQGVGRALIEAVGECAKAGGASSVYWQTHETNATAMRLYDRVAAKSGFLVYRRETV